MVTRCGASRSAAALGAWRVYADAAVDPSPIDPSPPPDPPVCPAAARFGHIDPLADALSRLAFRVEAAVDSPPGTHPFRPSVLLVFEGPHVLDGLHEMCVRGQADVRRMPAWLTGDSAATDGTVRDGVLVDE
ncbi:hypothetical protein PMAC_000805 [Pneumocystis sp. 'macacae']|nr:hypothetical protein PMAC_000805 [Pneumocystis sp. 'macacae']